MPGKGYLRVDAGAACRITGENTAWAMTLVKYLFGGLLEKNENAKLYFICGTDMFISLESWKYPERIFKNAVLVTAARDKNEYLSLYKFKRLFKKKYNARCNIVLIKPFPVSSSLIREMVGKGEDVSKYLDKNVMEYMNENGLYR